MAATVITYAIQKGGVGKSTTSGITAHLLAEKGNRVLAIDMDSQGNLTQFLTGSSDLTQWTDKTVLEAMKDKDPRGYIVGITEQLHLLPADDYLATLPRYLFKKYQGDEMMLLKETIDTIRNYYDYIIIDTPPALSEQTLNALCASDFVVVMFESSQFCYNAISRFMETAAGAKEKKNPELEIAGILCTLNDKRRTDSKALIDAAKEEYPNLVFDTVINRKAATGRLPLMGFEDNPELNLALDQHKKYLEELMRRVQKARTNA